MKDGAKERAKRDVVFEKEKSSLFICTFLLRRTDRCVIRYDTQGER